MALNNPDQTAPSDTLNSQVGPGRPEADSEEEEDDEEDLEKLESDVKHMAKEILDYRANLPEQLNSTFTSILSAQRPFLTGIDSEAGTSDGNRRDSGPDKVSKRWQQEWNKRML